MSVQLKSGGLKIENSSKSIRRTETYYGFETELDEFLSTRPAGAKITGLGTVTRHSKRKCDGGLFEADIEYSTELDDSGNPVSDDATGPQSQRLSCSRLSLPIEQAPKYLANWNHYLIGLGDAASTIPAFWYTAKNTFLSRDDLQSYRWVESIADIPTEPDTASGEFWMIVSGVDGVCEPRKPGVTYYDYGMYQITETGRHNTKNAAGWAAARSLNKIYSSPLLGDFGLTSKLGGDWKCDDANVEWNGENWIANMTYTLSGDANGWDRDLYEEGD